MAPQGSSPRPQLSLRQVFRGFGGSAPEWYGLLRAAKYLGVAPWDLNRQPLVWRLWAHEAEGAEAAAQKHARKK